MGALSPLTTHTTPSHASGNVTFDGESRPPHRLPWPNAALVVLGFCLLLWAGLLAAVGAFMGG
jgi:hypothetical protein